MNKEEFFESLEKEDLTQEQKIEACQFYIDNFPVVLQFEGPTKLQNLTISGGSKKSVDYAFQALQKRKEELKDL